MKDVLVLGKNGTVGSAFKDYTSLTKEECDITNICSINDAIKYYSPKVIINCAGIVGMQNCEDNRGESYLVNVGGVVNLAYLCKNKGIKLIHISTVYAGNENTYAHSKLIAEQTLFRICPNYLVIALPWVFNDGDDSFINKALSGPVSLYESELGYLAYAPDVVKFIEEHRDLNGYISLANKGILSRPDAIQHMEALLGKKISYTAIQRSLSVKKSINEPVYAMRPWQEALKEYLDGIRPMQSSI